jgi:hypothetical protein
MTEIPTKKYIPTPQKREYYRNYKRKARITNKKCSRCGAQGYAKVGLTQVWFCAKHFVAPLKEELNKQVLEKK